ncbi:YigZ family protein [Mycoplasma flocculare]|uniref:YigZ family protein n=1 Tax=Mesomycoplasma flocculare TaxID=2128 RepID=A0AAW9XAV7_MESFC|nr:YigZ family protein [Mesomycoplasma flocculare]MXR39682.1 YigZ family protein [Mycoplasma sp. MF12]MXR06126.1 YigZ family protein [Mesomycoplasma flocculare]MXR13816.1 YigZ family protein [Mesomycoplasma flocculare]MXR56330.1 YigZ family protein [Mesomycoplasma flocculare]MXR56907.1 YigZ family protein [Mesomycoplasma flocculare]
MEKTITQEASFSFEIKKSRFISLSFIIKSEASFNFLIEKIKKDYKNATHIVFGICFSLYNCKFSDGNEPKGSAGKQIFHILHTQKIINSLIVIIRFLNGGKLGLGLLQNSYKKAAREVLKLSKINNLKIWFPYQIEIQIKNLPLILQVIKKNNCKIKKKEFFKTVKIEFECETDLDENFGFTFQKLKK